MRIGNLYNRVTIERATEAIGSAGGRTKSWDSFYECWANILPVQGTETVKSNQNKATRQLSIIVRYTDRILPTDRVILDGGNVLQIVYVDNVSWGQKYTKLLCVETVGEGR